MALNINYKQDNEFLPQNIRAFLQQPNKITVQSYDAYFSLFDVGTRNPLFNNWNAAKIASGWTPLNISTLQSGIAPRLLRLKTQKTVGKVYFQAPEDSEENVDNVLPKDYLSKKLFETFEKASKTGRCVLVLYSDENGTPYLETYDCFRHKLVFNKKKEIIKADLFLCKIEDISSSASAFSYYYIVEHRFYDADGIPCQKIGVVYQMLSRENTYDAKITFELETDKIPDWIKEQYKGVAFNKVVKLRNELSNKGFSDLGVYHIDETAINNKYPDYDIPEAMFVDTLDTIVTIEQGLTDKEVEKEIGRGQVLIPEFGKTYGAPVMGNTPNSQAAISIAAFTPAISKNPVIQKYPTRSMEDSKPQNVQFDIRPDQWALSINEDICRLCALVGIGVIDYDSRLLAGSSQRTDDEINAMTDITRQTVEAARNLNEPEINKMLACLCGIYGLEKPLKIRWSMSTIINPSKNALRVTQLYTAQLISKKQALRELYPDLMEEEIEQIYNEIKEETSYNPEKEIINDYNNF